jgi:predicted RNA binding protein YcfA (HicA-like mRNA interferase family)
MLPLPIITGKKFIKFLESLGFVNIRVNGSHYRMR